jgi:hypothetical protein
MGEWTARERERDRIRAGATDVAPARPEPAVSALLRLQREAGNQAAAAMVARLRTGAVARPALQRTVKANVALNKLAKLIQNAQAVSATNDAGEIMDLRLAIEQAKAEHGKGGGDLPITAQQETQLNAIETRIIQAAPVGVNMAQVIADTTTGAARDAQAIVDAGGGRAASLPLAMLVAKMNRNRKMDIEIEGGTTRPAVRAAALADGYRLFAHVHYTQTPDANDPAQITVALNNPAHPFATEFDTHMRSHLADAGFAPYKGWDDIVVYTDDEHTVGALTTAINAWHPGIASDKTQPGEFREDDPHPQVANAVHNSRAHTHMQAPGCLQTTILI